MKYSKVFAQTDLKNYITIAIAGILAFSPVSFMLFALKNDIIAIDYPIKYFINQCLQNNISPFWFNTWAKGFPLESIVTWSFFSPLQFLSAVLINYNLYWLHAEFIFYILLSGFGMFYFLTTFSTNKDLCTILAISYMLSGFIVGSSQWMTYLTAAAFLPIVFCSFFKLLKHPSLKTTLLFVAFFYIALTSIYPAFSIIMSYLLFIYLLCYLLNKYIKQREYFVNTKILKYLLLTTFLMIVVYSTCIYYSLKTLSNMQRGTSLNAGTSFFTSNYLHPKGLITLLLPFSSVRLSAFNTEGTMLNCYIGLFPILLFLLSLLKNRNERNLINFGLAIIACFFLFISFGSLTPLRDSLNILPGFSYFRNAALFRLFFIFTFLTYLARTFKNVQTEEIFYNKAFVRTAVLAILICSCFFVINIQSLSFLSSVCFHLKKQSLTAISLSNTLLISAFLQIIFLLLFIFYRTKKRNGAIKFLFLLDLIINCLLCTPFFTVGSYNLKDTTDKIFTNKNGFPVQSANLGEVTTALHYNKANWYNVNVYKKQVSALDSYFGPLILRTSSLATKENDSSFYNRPIVFTTNAASLKLSSQFPDYVSVLTTITLPTNIIFQQNFYDGWHAYYNKKETKIIPIKGGMQVTIPKGGIVEFKYDRTALFIIVTIINLLILGIVLYFILQKFRMLFRRNLRQPAH